MRPHTVEKTSSVAIAVAEVMFDMAFWARRRRVQQVNGKRRLSSPKQAHGRLLRLHGPRYLCAFFLDVLGPLGSFFAALGALLAALGRS